MSDTFITPEALLEHWQGHRRLTRRVIEAFPDDKPFTFSVGSMRPFGALALEMLSIALPMVRGIVDDKWDSSFSREERSKSEILRLWDDATQQMNATWPNVPRGFFPCPSASLKPPDARMEFATGLFPSLLLSKR